MEFDLLTYIAPIVAIFLAWKLRSVLGTRDDSQPQRPTQAPNFVAKNSPPMAESKNDNVIKIADKKPIPAEINALIDELGDKYKSTLEQLYANNNNFSPKEFLTGAKIAYEMIVVAFAKGDLPKLENLLDKQLYDDFAKIIKQRQDKGEKIEIRFIGIEKSKIIDLKIENKTICITVDFISQMVETSYDKENNIINGDISKVSEKKDTWVFAKELDSTNPNWKLFATDI